MPIKSVRVGLNLKGLKIRLEPGLFEWMAWYPDGVPDWLTEEEVLAAQFNIDSSHKPFLTVAQLNDAIKETTEEFYTRNSDILRKISDVTSEYLLRAVLI